MNRVCSSEVLLTSLAQSQLALTHSAKAASSRIIIRSRTRPILNDSSLHISTKRNEQEEDGEARRSVRLSLARGA